jgi:hypothetical protein
MKAIFTGHKWVSVNDKGVKERRVSYYLQGTPEEIAHYEANTPEMYRVLNTDNDVSKYLINGPSPGHIPSGTIFDVKYSKDLTKSFFPDIKDARRTKLDLEEVSEMNLSSELLIEQQREILQSSPFNRSAKRSVIFSAPKAEPEASSEPEVGGEDASLGEEQAPEGKPSAKKTASKG